MRQCLRCNRATVASSAFCESCQASLLNRSQEEGGADIRQAPPVRPQTDQEEERNLPDEGDSHGTLVLRENAQLVKELSPVLQENSPALRSLLSEVQEFPPEVDELLPALEEKTITVEREKQQPIRTGALSSTGQRKAVAKRLRTGFRILTVVAILALLVDLLLVYFVFLNRSSKQEQSSASPIIMAVPGIARRGQPLKLQLKYFPSSSQVLLTRDIQESVRTENASPFLTVNEQGEAEVLLHIDDSWKAGSHSIQAQDVHTHYVASTVIEVVGAGRVQPPRIQIRQRMLDMGAALQGANTIQPLQLLNSGGGAISWTASSNQRWLFPTPSRGTFSSGQNIAVAVSRAKMAPGEYKGEIQIASNTGVETIQVKMVVLPLHTTSSSVMSVVAPGLSFTTSDGDEKRQEQTLTVRNEGKQPLRWKVAGKAAMPSLIGSPILHSDVDWLTISPSQGEVAPGKTQTVHVRVKSRDLLPYVYGSIVTFSAEQQTLNTPQSVAIALDVLPACGLATDRRNLSFEAAQGQTNVAPQQLGIHLASTCNGRVSWRAKTQAKWLAVSPASGWLEAGGKTMLQVEVKQTEAEQQGFIILESKQQTQTVLVQLHLSSTTAATPTVNQITPSVQPTETASETAKEASYTVFPSLVTFNISQGKSERQQQEVLVSNTGQGELSWEAHIDSAGADWLSLTQNRGMLAAGKSDHLTLEVDPTNLRVGSYSALIKISVTDMQGNTANLPAQAVTVMLNVIPPCSFTASPAELVFGASLLNPKPGGQDIQLNVSGACSYPVTWQATIDAEGQDWIQLSLSSGVDNGQGSTITVHVNPGNRLLGTYKGTITITAVDQRGQVVRGSPQSVTVTLNVLP